MSETTIFQARARYGRKELRGAIAAQWMGLRCSTGPCLLFQFQQILGGGLNAGQQSVWQAVQQGQGGTRGGDARFRSATIGLALALVVLLALFSLFSRGLAWLLIMVVLMVAAILLLRPAAHDWFVDR